MKLKLRITWSQGRDYNIGWFENRKWTHDEFRGWNGSHVKILVEP